MVYCLSFLFGLLLKCLKQRLFETEIKPIIISGCQIMALEGYFKKGPIF
jgi:hypothetical protein